MTASHASVPWSSLSRVLRRLAAAAAQGLNSLARLFVRPGDRPPAARAPVAEPLEGRRLLSGVTIALGAGDPTGEGEQHGGYLYLPATVTTPNPYATYTVSVDWGDGSPTDTFDGPLTDISHVYVDGDATCTITATVFASWPEVDGNGDDVTVTGSATDTKTVSVENVEPTFTLDGPPEVEGGDAYTVSAYEFFDPAGAPYANYDTVTESRVDWGDGRTETFDGHHSWFDHTYDGAADASYTVTVTYTDEDGSYSRSTTVKHRVPRVTLHESARVFENAGNAVMIHAERDVATGAPVVVQLARGGSAVFGQHYTDTGLTLTIPAGQTRSSGVVTVTPLDDAFINVDRTVAYRVASAPKHKVASPSTAVVTIADDDRVRPAGGADQPPPGRGGNPGGPDDGNPDTPPQDPADPGTDDADADPEAWVDVSLGGWGWWWDAAWLRNPDEQSYGSTADGPGLTTGGALRLNDDFDESDNHTGTEPPPADLAKAGIVPGDDELASLWLGAWADDTTEEAAENSTYTLTWDESKALVWAPEYDADGNFVQFVQKSSGWSGTLADLHGGALHWWNGWGLGALVEPIAASGGVDDLSFTASLAPAEGDAVEDTAKATVYDAKLTAHRTGGKFGEAVDPYTQWKADAGTYLVLTNNDSEEGAEDGGRDYDNDTAVIPSGNPAEGADDDLAKVTLRPPTPLPADGKVELLLSDPTAVRLFKPDGSLLYAHRSETDPEYDAGVNSLNALKADLGGSGYLGSLAGSDVDVWVEGLHQSPNFALTLAYRDGDGWGVASDTVHVRLADFTFRNPANEQVDAGSIFPKEALLAAADGQTDAPPPPDEAKSRFHIDGFATSDVESVVARSLGVPSDTYEYEQADYVEDPYGLSVRPTEFVVAYSSEVTNDVLTAAQRNKVRQSLDVLAIHNDGYQVMLTTLQAADVQKRAAVTEWQIDPVLSDSTWEPPAPVANPAAIVNLSGQAPTADNVANLRITRVPQKVQDLGQAFDGNLRLYWVAVIGADKVEFYTPPGGAKDDAGTDVRVYGKANGSVTFEARMTRDQKGQRDPRPRGSVDYTLDTYEAIVTDLIAVTFRVQLLTDPDGRGTRFTAQNAASHVGDANRLLRQLGVVLVPDVNETAEDGATMVPGMPGYFTANTGQHKATFGVKRAWIDQPGGQFDRTKGMDKLLQINNWPGVLQIMYVNDIVSSDGASLASGFAASFPALANPLKNVKKLTYRIQGREASTPHLLQYRPTGFNGGDGNQNWGLFLTSAEKVTDPQDPDGGQVDTSNIDHRRTLAHEVGHYFGLLHRKEQEAGLWDKLTKPGNINLMAFQRGKNQRGIDFDLAQVYVAHQLPGE